MYSNDLLLCIHIPQSAHHETDSNSRIELDLFPIIDFGNWNRFPTLLSTYSIVLGACNFLSFKVKTTLNWCCRLLARINPKYRACRQRGCIWYFCETCFLWCDPWISITHCHIDSILELPLTNPIPLGPGGCFTNREGPSDWTTDYCPMLFVHSRMVRRHWI